ncbi:peptidase M50 [Vogesella sp. EB]|uniref:site-2 protease family protein n=1 Tax=Vogesella TaxID=57739 RepID=UPI00064D0BF0|nr:MULTISPECIES: site-2 protease family protein [Vogesella]KMJ54113.1 peptidase M50 [Vogesella sp. EB]MDC7699257.1 site-2 protease family protein [Vogesella indigofera]
MEELNLIQKIAIYALPVLLAITLHEAAHAYAAKRFGDATAYMMGRMTLNPLKHIDPVGTVLLPLLSVVIGGFLFGWAKPVPVNFGALRNPRVGMRWVAAAGPAANLVMAIMWVLLLKLAIVMDNDYSRPLALMSQAGIGINVVLMVLNLMPILPLDGGRIVESLLPHRLAYNFSRLEPYGMWILLALVFTGLLSPILRPFTTMVYELLGFLL